MRTPDLLGKVSRFGGVSNYVADENSVMTTNFPAFIDLSALPP